MEGSVVKVLALDIGGCTSVQSFLPEKVREEGLVLFFHLPENLSCVWTQITGERHVVKNGAFKNSIQKDRGFNRPASLKNFKGL